MPVQQSTSLTGPAPELGNVRKPPDGPTSSIPWSWKLGQIAGIPVYVHATFLVLLAWAAVAAALNGRSIAAFATGVVFVLGIFACIVLHELGHALVARRFGVRTRDIVLLPIGGIARMERMPQRPTQELLVALAGPAVSLAIALALFAIAALLGSAMALRNVDLIGGPVLVKLAWVNVFIAGFNLVPAFPMDGGRVLRALLSLRMDRARATTLAAGIGQGLAVVFAALGIFVNPFLVIIAVFVWIGAKSEASLAEARSNLSRVPVSRAMIADFQALHPSDPLARAVELTLAGFQHEFPVLDGTRIAGLLTKASLLSGLAERGPDARVEGFLDQRWDLADPAEMLDVALERLESQGLRALFVVRDQRLVGIVTPESIRAALALIKAGSAGASAHAAET